MRLNIILVIYNIREQTSEQFVYDAPTVRLFV